MTDAYCRGCHATFVRPLPAPYGSICPHCMARGDIVTLTDVPRRRLTGRSRRRRDAGTEQDRAQHERTSGPPR